MAIKLIDFLLRVHLQNLVKTKNILKNSSSSGFTLLEILVIVILLGILSAIAIPNWLAFVDIQRLNTAQDKIYVAMRQAQTQAIKEKLNWQVSFREQNNTLQWSVHRATVNASSSDWNNLDSNIRLDSETTLRLSNGISKVQFNYKGHPQELRRITLYSTYGGKTKRCVYISTLIGAIRRGREQTRPKDGDYCY
ncbi:GspH/FimT family pseudopilin [Fortiea contorta]|uniref:GspH/FimT family pseudopilin n=1 Tax=Fortiea contorta TaxID=1892405 RepID=UPI000344DCF3|nr:prepilin-type N-terminal cleavage/methylation domain-containing protein [Fortiea contorta]